MKCKYEMRQIVYKCHEYKIILFPVIRDIRLYNAHPCEPTYDVVGSADSMREFAKCFAIAIADPQAIIYIPMKQNGVSDFNMILTRHSIDKFRPSIWYKIKHNLRKAKRSRKYVLSYDSLKLQDYALKIENESSKADWQYDNFLFRQTELGDTIFCQYSLHDLYRFHNNILQAISSLESNSEEVDICWGLGWVCNKNL